jgi:hypothetical protein
LYHKELLEDIQETIDKIRNDEEFGTVWADVLFYNMNEQLKL